MKQLTLIRHAEAEIPSNGIDIDRILSTYGSQMAPVIGRRLERQGLEPDIVYASPAARAIETAQIICYEIGFSSEQIHIRDEIYRASVPTLVQLLHDVDEAKQHLLIFGHNPTLTDFANFLCSNKRISHMSTCGVVKMNLPIEYWALACEACAEFIEYDTPENVS